MSLFVNPAQFGEPADLNGYPRDEGRDLEVAREAGVDVVFAPSAVEMYPPGYQTWVDVTALGALLEGEHRPGHFRGVATICLKLFTIVRPDLAFFGQKDAQQVAVIRRMVRDLDLPVRIEVLPTLREPDGLAMSSRNVHLSPADRPRALALRAALGAAEAAHAAGERDAEALRRAGLEAMRPHGVEPEYLALVDPDDFSPLTRVDGRVLVAVAARVGPTRLIDNVLIEPSQAGSST
jgi:pantoate--beta-alanine ligase